jgi:hypothetical protein
MTLYEILPAYVFPWLNSVSIPVSFPTTPFDRSQVTDESLQCLAAQKATGSKAAVFTNLFGGASNNEGLGLFSLSLDWQYVRIITSQS